MYNKYVYYIMYTHTHTHTHTHIYIYIFFKAVIITMSNFFPKSLKTHLLLCKYFAVISVASSAAYIYIYIYIYIYW